MGPIVQLVCEWYLAAGVVVGWYTEQVVFALWEKFVWARVGYWMECLPVMLLLMTRDPTSAACLHWEKQYKK